MLRGIKVFCVHLEGTELLDGMPYQIEEHTVENDNILIKVKGCDEFYFMDRFEKVEDVIKVSIERNIEIKEAIRVFI